MRSIVAPCPSTVAAKRPVSRTAWAVAFSLFRATETRGGVAVTCWNVLATQPTLRSPSREVMR